MLLGAFFVIMMQLSHLFCYRNAILHRLSAGKTWNRCLSALHSASTAFETHRVLDPHKKASSYSGLSLGLKMSGVALQLRGGLAARNYMSFAANPTAELNSGDSSVKEFFRKDYQAYPYTIRNVDLDFILDDKETIVTATNSLFLTGTSVGEDLILDGEEVTMIDVFINGNRLTSNEFKVDKDKLIIAGRVLKELDFADGVQLKTVVSISPEKNLALSGLYKSGSSNLLCTQCEAMGYRRITYSLDRPDILSVYRVRMEADRTKYPILLSNGNLVAEGLISGSNKHWAIWEDPFPKPSYLFAVVAGDLGFIHDTYTTTSGRVVKLGIYSDKENVDKLDHAMYSLKESMKWDEDTFNLECDLDIYNIVATNDFNMGAMYVDLFC